MADFEEVRQEDVEQMVGALPPPKEEDDFADADEYVELAEQQVKEQARKDALLVAPPGSLIAPLARSRSSVLGAKFVIGRGDSTYKNRVQLRGIGCRWTGAEWVAPTDAQRIAGAAMCQTFPEGAPDEVVEKLRAYFGIVEPVRGLNVPTSFKPLDTIEEPPEMVEAAVAQALSGTANRGQVASVVAGIAGKHPLAVMAALITASVATPSPAAPKAIVNAGSQPRAGAKRSPKQNLRPVLATDLGQIKQGHLDAIKGIPTEALIHELRRRNALEAPIETFGEALEEQIELSEDLDDAFEFDAVDISDGVPGAPGTGAP
jgi:hypothetical protein